MLYHLAISIMYFHHRHHHHYHHHLYHVNYNVQVIRVKSPGYLLRLAMFSYGIMFDILESSEWSLFTPCKWYDYEDDDDDEEEEG